MADTLSERLRDFADRYDGYAPSCIEEAAAELDRREAIVAAAEAWAKDKRAQMSLYQTPADLRLLALLPDAARKG